MCILIYSFYILKLEKILVNKFFYIQNLKNISEKKWVDFYIVESDIPLQMIEVKLHEKSSFSTINNMQLQYAIPGITVIKRLICKYSTEHNAVQT